MTLNGPRVTTGPNFTAYVQSLDLGRWGHYNVHNTRCVVERYLGPGNFFSLRGGAGRYHCSLQYPCYGRGNGILKIKFKKISKFFIFFSIKYASTRLTFGRWDGREGKSVPFTNLDSL